MIRIVLDTNVIASALLNSLGPPARIFLMTVIGTDAQLCVSAEIYAEYDEVLRRPHLRRSNREIEAALRAICDRGLWFQPTAAIRACSDASDDVFLECAEAAQAHFLVTGNTKHFPNMWKDTRIVTARQFIDTVS